MSDEDLGPACPACGGELVYIGSLGQREYSRCRNCGALVGQGPIDKGDA